LLSNILLTECSKENDPNLTTTVTMETQETSHAFTNTTDGNQSNNTYDYSTKHFKLPPTSASISTIERREKTTIQDANTNQTAYEQITSDSTTLVGDLQRTTVTQGNTSTNGQTETGCDTCFVIIFLVILLISIIIICIVIILKKKKKMSYSLEYKTKYPEDTEIPLSDMKE
ncbi:Hypothetical predicted protein, partial [Pelobates cultripes]